MKIIEKKIVDLNPAEYNPRKIGTREKMELTKSIKKFDFVQPIVVNVNKKRFNIIVGGHQKVKIAKELGLKTVPCVEVDLNKEQEEEFSSEILEENNYLVFVFDNSIDWLTISDKFGLKSVNALDSKTDYKRKGVGRVLDGNKLLDLIK